MQGIQVIITFEARPSAVASLSALLSQVRQQLPKVEGCNGVRVLASSSASNIFTLVEDWQSAVFHKRHLDHVVASGAWDAIAGLLASEPVSHTYREMTV